MPAPGAAATDRRHDLAALRRDFALERPLRASLPVLAGEVAAQDYDGDGVVLTIRLPQENEASFRAAVADLSRGQARFLPET